MIDQVIDALFAIWAVGSILAILDVVERQEIDNQFAFERDDLSGRDRLLRGR